MPHIPRLYETPQEAIEPIVEANLAPLTAARSAERDKLTKHRRNLALIAMGIVLTPIAVKGLIDSHGYGFHPSNTPAQTSEAPR